eukprot:CAMPEP_0202940722 /NCGR_PEP_ID=MMETSP1395-20130829/846_1 /ASSEMBLY_ACC=CAM_ASM_000871 /TAXON_ID=5961 /ORGANISM="Blepharisma japonicum, Strain Stock R1072" /LENGTH=428 /DNA_ID=CAMNT_0049635365 /DNA_START=177 /DNA_END=1463 /DNA_ORIENTATION=-
MRYYVNSNYWNSTKPGPIFFGTGGDGPIEDYISVMGYVDQLAQNLQALIVYGEHRYFGGSLPFGNLSYSSSQNLKYLSPHQALADYAYLISHLKTIYDDAPVISFGIRYSGMMSAWLRMSYDNLVEGAIASAASIMRCNGTVDPNQANEIVTNTFALVGPECPASIRTAFDYLSSLINNQSQYQQLSELFETCTPLQNAADVYALMSWIESGFIVMAVFDYPYPSAFALPIPGNIVNLACNEFAGVDLSNMWEVLEATKRSVNIYYNYTGENPCANIFNTYANGNFGNPMGWSYLTCTSLNMPYGGSAATSMFGDQPYDQTEQNNYCLSLWNTTANINYVAQWYGANIDPAVVLRYRSNIVFSNGSLDPWTSGAVTNSVGNSIVAFVMDGAASGMDLMAPSAQDPQDVITARATEKALIQYWLYGQNQ